MKRIVPLLALIMILAGCSQFFDRHIEYTTVEPAHFPVLKAVGYAPITLQPGQNDSHKILLAMKASKIEAYRELTELVYGQKVDSKNSLQAMVMGNDNLTASVEGVITGARVVKTYAIDDIYVTELELDFQEVYYIFQNVRPKQTIKSVKYF